MYKCWTVTAHHIVNTCRAWYLLSVVPMQDSDDIRFMCGALKDLGVKLEEDWANSKLTVHGCNGRFPSAGAELSLGNAGTAMRPLTAAVAAAGRGEFVLDGVARMRERPIQDLVDGLTQLGVSSAASCTCVLAPLPVRTAGCQASVAPQVQAQARSDSAQRALAPDIMPKAQGCHNAQKCCLHAAGVDAECTRGTGCPPVRVKADGLKGGKITISGAVSSQYLTALLMAAPLAQDEEVCICFMWHSAVNPFCQASLNTSNFLVMCSCCLAHLCESRALSLDGARNKQLINSQLCAGH